MRYEGSLQRWPGRGLNENATSGRAPARVRRRQPVVEVELLDAGVADDVVGRHDPHPVEAERAEARVVEHARLLLADPELEVPRGLGLGGESEDQDERQQQPPHPTPNRGGRR